PDGVVDDELGYLRLHAFANDRRFRGGRVWQQRYELVATATRREVRGAQAAFKGAGDERQRLVSNSVPKAVVDELEVAQVEQEHARPIGGARSAGYLARQRLVERPAVAEVGEVVDEG